MRSFFLGYSVLGLSLVLSSGCTLCDVGDLCDYPAVGGKWQRSNPACGRVGSIFSDAGAYPVAAGDTVGIHTGSAGTEGESSEEIYYDGAAAPYESIPDEAVSYPEGVIILGDEAFSR